MNVELDSIRFDDIAPIFRCTTNATGAYVEIPNDYERWISPSLHADLRKMLKVTIRNLCKEAGHLARVYDERKDDGRSKRHGWLVPIQDWDFAMSQKLRGWHVRKEARK